jgi:hypothetical protein
MDYVAIGGMVATGCGAAAAAWAAYEARRIRIEQHFPEVIAYLEEDPKYRILVNLVLHNVSSAPAYDVKIAERNEISDFQFIHPEMLTVVKKGLEVLAPHKAYRVMIGGHGHYQDWRAQITVHFSNSPNARRVYRFSNSFLLHGDEIDHRADPWYPSKPLQGHHYGANSSS